MSKIEQSWAKTDASRRVSTCIADAERTENSLPTRVDAAVYAISFLDQRALQLVFVKWFLTEKYVRAFDEDELRLLH